jgi:hypothetical protein
MNRQIRKEILHQRSLKSFNLASWLSDNPPSSSSTLRYGVDFVPFWGRSDYPSDAVRIDAQRTLE